MISFVRDSQIVLESDIPFYIPISGIGEFPLLHILISTWSVSVLIGYNELSCEMRCWGARMMMLNVMPI